MEFTPLACRMAHYASQLLPRPGAELFCKDYLGLASRSYRGRADESYWAAGSLITKRGGGGQKPHLGGMGVEVDG